MVLEVVIFKLNEGVSGETFLAASDNVQAVLERFPGYISRELSANDDGTWVDIVHWASMDEAKSAAEQFMTMPEAAVFEQTIDAASTQMFHVQQKRVFGVKIS